MGSIHHMLDVSVFLMLIVSLNASNKSVSKAFPKELNEEAIKKTSDDRKKSNSFGWLVCNFSKKHQ